MGCWNATCAITNQSIRHGEEVRVILLREKKKYESQGGGTCYSTELFMPMGLPIRSIYDDYGSVEEIVDSPFNEFFLADLSNAVVVDEKETREKYDPKSMKSLMDAIRSRGVTMKQRGDDGPDVCFMMVKETNFRSAIKALDKKPGSYWEKSGQFIKEADKDARDVLCVLDGKPLDTKGNRMAELYNEELAKGLKNDGMLGRRWLRYCRWFGECNSMSWDYDVVINFLGKCDYRERMDVIATIAEFKLFDAFMSRARRLYQPCAGAGSQNDNLELLNEFNRLTAIDSKALLKKWKKEYGE
jgi:hypothetical protein